MSKCTEFHQCEHMTTHRCMAARECLKGQDMAKTTTRSRTATIRFSPENLAAAEKVAALTGRTVSSLAEYALVLFMRQNYPLAYTPGAVLALKLDEAPKLTQPQFGPGVLVGGHALPYTRPVFEAP
jgi:hypothetical protein